MTQQRSDYPVNSGSTGANTADRLSDMAGGVTDKLKEAADNAQEMAGKVADQAREYGGKALEAAQQIKPIVEKSLKEQPMATLAGVAAIGFVLGALWKR